MNWLKKWAADPVCLLNTLSVLLIVSVLLIGVGLGFLIKDYLL